MRTPARALSRVLVTVVLLPIVLLGVELVVWGFKGVGEARKDVIEAPYMPTRLRPDFRGNVGELYFETNRYGFRSEPDFDPVPDPAEYRIMLLGDSVGFGFGIEAEDHFTKVAERYLNNSSDETRRYHLINAAGQGYSPSSYYAYLLHEGLDLNPEIVLIQVELCNDVPDEALLRWSFDPGGPALPNRVRGGRYVVGWDGSLLGTVAAGPYLYETSYAYTALLRRVLDLCFRWFPRGPLYRDPGATYFHLGFDRFLLTDEGIESGWDRLAGSLEAIRDLLDRHDKDFLLLILPSRYMFEPQSPLQRAFALSLYQRALEEARSRSLSCLVFDEELESGGGASLFLDFAHPSREGNRVIGEKLGSFLSSKLSGTGASLPETP